MRRTSIRVSLLAFLLAIVGLMTLHLADAYHRNLPNRINFGVDMGRPWNFWDYVWIPAFVLSAAFFVAGLMLADRDD